MIDWSKLHFPKVYYNWECDQSLDIRPNHVAIYIRWSTEDQGDGTTLAVQKDGCSHYVLSQGWAVNEDLIFIDDGYSGGSMKRPAMTALRKRVHRGDVDCVVVYKLDRLSRSVLDTVNLVLEEWDDRCFVKSAREPIDTTSPSGKLFFYMLLSYAEWERSVIKERTFSGRIRRAQEGRIAGAHPYGYKLGEKPGTLEIVPEEAAIVRRIYTEYEGGKGTLPICNDLNADGIPTSRGKGRKWHRSTIRHILQNPLYKGEYRFLQQRVNPKHARNPQEPWRVKNDQPIVAQAVGVPIIIEPEFFNRVQARARSRHRDVVAPRSIDSDHLLTGILRCRCGASMCGARPQRIPYYSCCATRDSGNSTCDCGWIKQADVDSVVMAKVMDRYGSPDRRLQYFRQLADVRGRLQDDASAELAALKERLKALDAEAARLNQTFRAGELRVDLYQENRTELD